MGSLKVFIIHVLAIFISINCLLAQSDSKKDRIINDSQQAKVEFMNADKSMKGLFAKAYAYVIFPNVGKGGIGVGGAAGNGTAYEQGKLIRTAKLTQVSIGLQLGGQSYREVIFFKGKEEMKRFKDNRVEVLRPMQNMLRV